MRDIESKEDITRLVEQFYDKVLNDNLIRSFFNGIDFEHHLPKMIHFWSFVLLNEPGYTNDVTKTHINMAIKKEHFDRWIELFNETVNELFAGEKAELAKQRAFLIRWTLEGKIKGD